MPRRPVDLLITMKAVDDDRVVLIAAGEVDLRSCGLLRDALTGAFADGPPVEVLVDLSAVSFCDCVGIGTLLAARATAARHRIVLRVVNPQRNVRRVLRLSGVLDVLAADPRREP